MSSSVTKPYMSADMIIKVDEDKRQKIADKISDIGYKWKVLANMKYPKGCLVVRAEARHKDMANNYLFIQGFITDTERYLKRFKGVELL